MACECFQKGLVSDSQCESNNHKKQEATKTAVTAMGLTNIESSKTEIDKEHAEAEPRSAKLLDLSRTFGGLEKRAYKSSQGRSPGARDTCWKDRGTNET